MTLAADVVTYLIKAPSCDRQSTEAKLREGLRPYTRIPHSKEVVKYVKTVLKVPTHARAESTLMSVNTSLYEDRITSHVNSIKYDSTITRWLIIAYVNGQPYAGSVVYRMPMGYMVIENIELYPLPFMASFVVRVPDIHRLIQPAIEDLARKEKARAIYKIANESEGLRLILNYGYTKTNLMHTYMKLVDN